MLSKWPIRNKLLVCIGLLLVIVVTLAASGFQAAYAYRGLVKGLRGRATELPLAAQLSRDVGEARVTLGEASAYADQAEAESTQSAEEVAALRLRFARNMMAVKRTLRRYRDELAGNDESDDTINDSRDEWQTVRKIDSTLDLVTAASRGDDWLSDRELRGAVEKDLVELQDLCAEAPSFLHNRLHTMVGEVRTQYRTLIALNGITTLSCTLMLGLFLRLMYSWVFRPLRLLVKGSRHVASGDFDYRIQLHSRDEMAELADALNDMTARFQAIRNDLDRQVRERTKQVVRSEQLASVGFLAAGVAHEINNPLASIALCAESLESRVNEALSASPEAAADPQQQKVIHNYLRMIQNEAFRCKGITERLLDFSRLGDIKPQPTDLGELVQNVIDMLGHLGKYHGKHLRFEPAPPVVALINPQEMKQVVLNLLANGLDALGEEGTVRVEVGIAANRAVLTITDDGCGMTDEVRRHLFEPFFTRRRTGQGIGLGLSITYRIVADHGGQIDVYRAGPGQGSRFRVTLPLAAGTKEISIATKPHNRLKLLFADDERSLQELMTLELPRMGHEVTVCPDGLTAVAALKRNSYDCILVDLDMPGMSGIEVIGKAKELSPQTEAVVLTGKSSLETAVAALRHGVFDYLTKPCKLVELQALLNRVAEKREMTHKYMALKRQLERIEGKSELVGNSAGMQRVRKLIAKVAPTNSTALILGETGTGKEFVARALHDQSLRSDLPFVAVNCGALPESLIESELFGHRKGAFTGADQHRVGLFEVANGGTLFLDEIGELPKSMQAKLLRVMESGEIRRLGENDAFTVDVRTVCATHRNLEQMVSDGDFREDLMFRINTFEIHLPALRERAEDLPALARHLLRRFQPALAAGEPGFSPEVLRAFAEHSWPGNVRELANVIEHATILCDDGPIELEHLPNKFESRRLRGPHIKSFGPQTLREIELQAICDTLERLDGNKPKAAEELGISLKTLYNKLNQTQSLDKSA